MFDGDCRCSVMFECFGSPLNARNPGFRRELSKEDRLKIKSLVSLSGDDLQEPLGSNMVFGSNLRVDHCLRVLL